MDVSIEAIIVSLANIGAVGYLIKRVVGKVDAHSDILPRMLATQESIAASLASIDANQAKLWMSRDDHDKHLSLHDQQLARIEFIHDFHGCNQQIKATGQ